MKTTRIVLIIILSGFIFFLCGFLCGFLCLSLSGRLRPFSGRASGVIPGNYELVMEKELPANGVESLNIQYDMNSNSVYFYLAEDENITIEEYLNFKPEEGQLSRIEQNGKELLIRGQRRNSGFSFFSMGGKDGYIKVYLPSGLLEKLSVTTVSGDICSDINFTVEAGFLASSTSGDISFQEVEAGKISASSTSGEISFEKAKAEHVAAATTSGDICLEEAAGRISAASTSGEILLRHAAGDVDISTTSGDVHVMGGDGVRNIGTVSGEIEIEELSGSFDLSTTSGDIAVRSGKGHGKAGTTSGEVAIALGELMGDLRINTISGEVNLKIPTDSSFALEFDSNSGDCNTFFDGQLSFNKKGNHAEGSYGEDADKAIDVSTVSGDLRISEY